MRISNAFDDLVYPLWTYSHRLHIRLPRSDPSHPPPICSPSYPHPSDSETSFSPSKTPQATLSNLSKDKSRQPRTLSRSLRPVESSLNPNAILQSNLAPRLQAPSIQRIDKPTARPSHSNPRNFDRHHLPSSFAPQPPHPIPIPFVVSTHRL